MKTYEISKLAAYEGTVGQKRVAVFRDEKSNIRESILMEILTRFDTANESGFLTRFFERLDTGIKDKETGNMTVFTKGFRASSTKKKANLKSLAQIDRVIIEEAEDIEDKSKFNTLKDGVRKQDSAIILVLNTPSVNHWIAKQFFVHIPVHVDEFPELLETHDRKLLKHALKGYYRLQPKDDDDLLVIQTNYDDNPHLIEAVKRDYRNYGDPKHSSYDLHYYLTAILGLASTGLKGVILTNWEVIPDQVFHDVDATMVYGQDFGTTSPAAFGACKCVGDKVYVHGLNYEGKDVGEIGKMYSQFGFDETTFIIADSAEKDTILSLRNGMRDKMSAEDVKKYPAMAKGFHNIHGARKPAGSVKTDISMLKSKKIYITESSVNIINEFMTYVWMTDAYGVTVLPEKPVDANNHHIDWIRYVVKEHGRKF